ncbi:hypothetical protein [Celeribacter neptunius]|uniref:Secreted protein n=1 Tax=Celeribacter neptunius TaxID=588602 RepID=A0A1I3KNG1_9RHOB|nr:hypothetical protein [Celeribacter neptunius]SFI73890.1 hypothetical protein SAMN04487991_0744 [Celeribacter neptunius]
MKSHLAAPIFFALSLGTAVPAVAQGRPNVDAIAADLGITSQELTQCFRDNRPPRSELRAAKDRFKAGETAAPDGARPEMVACVQSHNPEITTERYEEVLRAHAPERS